MFRTSPEHAIQIEALVAALNALPVGQTITYDALSEAIGKRVQTDDGRFLLIRARRLAEKQTGTLFATVFGVGVKRLPADEAAGVGSDVRQRIRRSANRTYARLSDIRYNDITPDVRQRIDAERSLMGAIASLATQTSANSVAKHTQTGPVPVAKLLAAIG
jgi:hypothetical protein